MTHGAQSVVGEESGDNVVEFPARRSDIREEWVDGAAAPIIEVEGEHVTIDLRDQSTHVTTTDGVSLDANLLIAAPWQMRVKRGVDVLGASFLLLMMLPLLVLVATAIKLTSRSGALRQ